MYQFVIMLNREGGPLYISCVAGRATFVAEPIVDT